MKVVTWNCAGAFRKKYEKIASLEADIYVIQECENPANTKGEFASWSANSIWYGKNKHKGLGVFAKPTIGLKRLDWPDNELLLFLPVRVNQQFNLIAAWTKTSPTYRYIGQLWQYLQLNKAKFQESDAVLCGDLNSNKIWDEPGRAWNHSAVIRELEDIKMVSLYHAITGEAQGVESAPTLYLQRNLKKSYHIDFAIVSNRIFNCMQNSVTVGSHREWLELSDHMPVTFTVNI